jgi:hypothetical protein
MGGITTACTRISVPLIVSLRGFEVVRGRVAGRYAATVYGR